VGPGPIQGLPARALVAGLRARLPVAEHLRGPHAALHAFADAEARRGVVGAVGGLPARLRSEGVRGGSGTDGRLTRPRSSLPLRRSLRGAGAGSPCQPGGGSPCRSTSSCQQGRRGHSAPGYGSLARGQAGSGAEDVADADLRPWGLR
jgi:hypothetical protein